MGPVGINEFHYFIAVDLADGYPVIWYLFFETKEAIMHPDIEI